MLLLLMMAAAAVAARAGIVDEIAGRYAGENGVGGRFEQRLVSTGGDERVYRGRYHYSSSEGLRWKVTAPESGELVIDSNGDAQVSGDLGGLRVFRKRTVGRLIVAMVSLDESVLERYYRVHPSSGPQGFEITLEARTRWRNVAGTVVIRGRRLVDTVHMTLPDGRAMELSLTHEQ